MYIADMLACLNETPDDDLLWLALADRLEEEGDTARAELVRLMRRLRGLEEGEPRWAMESRVRELLNGGTRPCVPEVVNSIGMRLALIPPGTFWMGSPNDEAERSSDEAPRHWVRITRPLWIGIYPVTQAQYEAVMGTNPSYFSPTGDGKDRVEGLDTSVFPVEMVSWHDAVAFCEALTSRADEKANKRVYRLPSEAEWEYICRAGLVSKPYHFGSELNGTQANCDGNYPYGTEEKGPHLERTCAVGSYVANGFGVYDMHGNVWEWCADWYAEDYYAKSPIDDPRGPEQGSHRVGRGGGWRDYSGLCRSAYRRYCNPSVRLYRLGFRVALVPGD